MEALTKKQFLKRLNGRQLYLFLWTHDDSPPEPEDFIKDDTTKYSEELQEKITGALKNQVSPLLKSLAIEDLYSQVGDNFFVLNNQHFITDVPYLEDALDLIISSIDKLKEVVEGAKAYLMRNWSMEKLSDEQYKITPYEKYLSRFTERGHITVRDPKIADKVKIGKYRVYGEDDELIVYIYDIVKEEKRDCSVRYITDALIDYKARSYDEVDYAFRKLLLEKLFITQNSQQSP